MDSGNVAMDGKQVEFQPHPIPELAADGLL